MKKMKTGICIVAVLTSCTVGCSNKIPEMSEQQQGLVVEYAASTLLKYDKYYPQKLVDVSELSQEQSIEEAERETENIMQGQLESQKTETSLEETEAVTVIDQTKSGGDEFSAGSMTIEEVLQVQDFSFQYVGYELVQDYPNDGEGLYFVMSAAPGNQLLILKFQAENLSDGDGYLDMNQIGARFKIVVDGEAKNALTTMLLNDMAHYQGSIASGEATELVLVCEIPIEKADNLTNLELIVKNVDNTATILLN